MWVMSSIFLSLDNHNGGRGKAHSAKRIAQKPEIRSNGGRCYVTALF